MGGSKHGIRFSTCTEVSVMYSSGFYSLTSSARLMEEKIRMINQTTLPVMILGERVARKNQLAAKLYLESSMQRYPYITIDCQVLNERTWNYIISNYNSPLNDKNNTIFISNLQALSRHQQGLDYCPFWWTQMPTSGIELFSPAPKHWIGTCRIRPETLSTICPAPPSTCRR